MRRLLPSYSSDHSHLVVTQYSATAPHLVGRSVPEWKPPLYIKCLFQFSFKFKKKRNRPCKNVLQDGLWHRTGCQYSEPLRYWLKYFIVLGASSSKPCEHFSSQMIPAFTLHFVYRSEEKIPMFFLLTICDDFGLSVKLCNFLMWLCNKQMQKESLASILIFSLEFDGGEFLYIKLLICDSCPWNV